MMSENEMGELNIKQKPMSQFEKTFTKAQFQIAVMKGRRMAQNGMKIDQQYEICNFIDEMLKEGASKSELEKILCDTYNIADGTIPPETKKILTDNFERGMKHLEGIGL